MPFSNRLCASTFAIFLPFISVALGQKADLQSELAAKQRERTMNAMTPSIELQKVSVKRQRSAAVQTANDGDLDEKANAPEFFVTEPLIRNARVTADCDQLSVLQVQSLTERAASANRVSADLVRAVMKHESGFRPCAVSDKGAMGLMQLMPDTAADLNVDDAFDPEQNAFGGAKLLRTLMDRYAGDLNRTLGAYNAGPARVDGAGGVPKFPETVTYVDKIMRDLAPTGAPR